MPDIGITIAQAINKKRFNNFIEREIKKLGIPMDKEFFQFNVVRYDNMWFQTRFVFLIIDKYIFIKRQLDKKSEWVFFTRNQLEVDKIKPSLLDKFGVSGIGEMLLIRNASYPKIFKNGARFFVESSLGDMLVTYDKEGTKMLAKMISKNN